MTSRKISDAVVAYRKSVVLDYDADKAREAVNTMTVAMSQDEFMEYHAMTREIDAAADQSQQVAEASHWKDSTARQQFKIAVNAAGKEH